MRPKLRIAYMDETDGWTEEIASAAGRVAGVFVFDENRHVFCCEMTPSYELSLAGYLTEHHVCDKLQLELAQATDFGQVRYVHCWQVDDFRRVRRRPGFRDTDPFAPSGMPCTLALRGSRVTDHDAAVEEALEALSLGGFTTT